MIKPVKNLHGLSPIEDWIHHSQWLEQERDKYRDACERLIGHYGTVKGHWICRINSCITPDCDDPDDLYIGHDDYVNGYDFARQVEAEIREPAKR